MAEITLRNETPSAKIDSIPPTLNREAAQVAPAAEAVSPEAVQLNSDPRIEHLAKRERALRHRDRQFKEREAQLQAEIQALKQKETEYQSNYIPKQKLREQTWDVLQNEGISYDQLTQAALQNPVTPEMIELRRVQEQIKKQEEAISAFKTDAQKAQEAQYTQALKLIERDVKSLVSSDPESYELVKAQGQDAEQAVVELIRETFDQEGILLSPEEALKDVEEYLLENAIKVAQLKKIQAKLMPKTPEIVTDPPLVRGRSASPGARVELSQTRPQPQQPLQPARTLTHQNPIQQRPISAKDKRERAIAAFQGKL